MSEYYCPFCGSKNANRTEHSDWSTLFHCEDCFKVKINQSILDLTEEEQTKAFHLIYEYMITHNKFHERNRYWNFFIDKTDIKSENENINIAPMLKTYPIEFIEKINRALINLSISFPNYYDHIDTEETVIHSTFSQDIDEAYSFLKLMLEMGYLNRIKDFEIYSISAEGWKKIDELKRNLQEINQGFIAMRFGEETKEIREAFRQGMYDAGFAAVAIDEKEHNHQIVPEIFYEIDHSKFIVVDITYPNYGAYYEAGYAEGKGKEVIVCCKKEIFENKEGIYERPHFDIAQKSMIIWDDYDDLKIRLSNRIKATVK